VNENGGIEINLQNIYCILKWLSESATCMTSNLDSSESSLQTVHSETEFKLRNDTEDM
jgi:hypothetical protein